MYMYKRGNATDCELAHRANVLDIVLRKRNGVMVNHVVQMRRIFDIQMKILMHMFFVHRMFIGMIQTK